MNNILISDPFLFKPSEEDPNPLTGYSINKYDNKSYYNKFFNFNQEQFELEWNKFPDITDNSPETHLFPELKENLKNNNYNNNNSTQQQLSISSSVLLSPSPIEHDHSYYNHHLIYSPQQPSTLTFYTFPDTPPSTFSDMMDFNNGSFNDKFLSEFSQDSPLIFNSTGEESGPLVDNEINEEGFGDPNFVFDELEMFDDNSGLFNLEKQKLQQQQLIEVATNNNNNNNNNTNLLAPIDWHSQVTQVSLPVVNNNGDNTTSNIDFTLVSNNFNNATANNGPTQNPLASTNTRKQHNRKANIQVREAPESPIYESMSMNEDSSHSSIYQQDIKPNKNELDESMMMMRNSRGATTTGAKRGRKRSVNTPTTTRNSRSTSTDSKSDLKKAKMYMNESDPLARNAVLARKNREKKKEEAMKIQEENKKLHQELSDKQKTVHQMAKSLADLQKQVESMKKKNRAEGGLQKVLTNAKDILESVMPPLIGRFGVFDMEVAEWFQRVGVPGNPNDIVLNLGDKPTSSYISLNISTEERKVKVNYNPDYFGTTPEPTS